jgi:hypothetical protein
VKPLRTLAPHLLALVLAGGFAVSIWTRDKEPRALAQGDVTVWRGRADDVTHVAFEGKNRTLSLDAKKDDRGRYFVGSAERPAPPPVGDAGAPAAAPTKTVLLSVAGGKKLAEALAPLKALRDVGKPAPDRAADFGLAEPEGTLKVTIGGAEHQLVIGGPTPGGSDRYVKDPSSGEVYAVTGDVFRDVESPDIRLLERELHDFKDAEIQRVHIAAGGKARDLVHGGAELKRIWADAASPEQNDETAGNWMAKLDRLRPLEYLTAPPEGKQPVVRVDFQGGSPLGWMEVVKVPATSGGKSDYYVQTERTRLFAKVSSTLAEQVEQDLASIVR